MKKKRLIVVLASVCMAALAFLSFSAFSCSLFCGGEKTITSYDLSMTVSGNFKQLSVSNDPDAVLPEIFKYRDDRDNILIAGSRVAKQNVKEYDVFDLPHFVDLVQLLYYEDGDPYYPVSYKEDENVYYAAYKMEFYSSSNEDYCVQYETCYEDTEYFYEISYTVFKDDWNSLRSTVEKYAASVRSTKTIDKYDIVKLTTADYSGLKVGLNSTMTESAAGTWTNGFVTVKAEFVSSEGSTPVATLDDMKTQVGLDGLVEWKDGTTESNTVFAYAVYDVNDNGSDKTELIAVFVGESGGYSVTYGASKEDFGWFEISIEEMLLNTSLDRSAEPAV